jgi:hypothetical protein
VGQEINSGLALKMLGPSVKSLGATMFFFFFFFFLIKKWVIFKIIGPGVQRLASKEFYCRSEA